MLHLFSILFLLLTLTSRADYLFLGNEPETSLPKLQQIAGIEVRITNNPSGQAHYEIEINLDSPFLARKNLLDAVLLILDATGKKVAEVPLDGFNAVCTTAQKKNPFYRVHFSLRDELLKTSCLQIGHNPGLRRMYQKVWLSEPEPANPRTPKPAQ